jgi:hypothetical protein
MLKKLMHLWNERFAPKEWDVLPDAETRTYRARRWANGAWEYRDATEEEAAEAYAWWSIR